jgi:hypothetical protein
LQLDLLALPSSFLDPEWKRKSSGQCGRSPADLEIAGDFKHEVECHGKAMIIETMPTGEPHMSTSSRCLQVKT